MGSKVIPVRLSHEVLETIDVLIRLGVFKSRSEAIKTLVMIGINNLDDATEIFKACEKLFELEKKLYWYISKLLF
jgi:metal-responsive CopG/Arc/MetJ family transcriptional regulator